MAHGISKMGAGGEQRFRDLTGWIKSPDKRKGDAKDPERDDFAEMKEIKKKTKKKSGTINQVRPAKFIPTVVYDGRFEQWYVIPPWYSVQEAASRARGQHTESPFECMTFRVGSLVQYKVSEGQLLPRLKEVFEQEVNYKDLKEIVQSHIKAVRAEVEECRLAIKKLTSKSTKEIT